MQNYLVYLIHGNPIYYYELHYSILSAYKHKVNELSKIVIYADDVVYIKTHFPEDIEVFSIDSTTIGKWKGKDNFIHRMKVKVIQDIVSKYEGNFLYLDSDTYFTKNCSEIFNNINSNSVYFDKCEGKLIDNKGGIARKMKAFLKNESEFKIPLLNETIKIDSDFTVWNAGVIGFNSSYSNQLKMVEKFVDLLYSKNQLFVMEQIAFNYFFQKQTTPFESKNYIHHYWYFKEFRSVLTHFFEHNKSKSFEEMIVEIDKINPEYLSSEKRAYKKMSFWKKQFHKIQKGRKWKILDYKL
ncbi:hypothetical protein [Flavobacterium chungnamense]|uniref:Glycosyl transferase n=1 Tax=Flavobacterium chungnamense TaxID=706182 RepID=A0ABP7UNN6_9FLAO